jgi:hypothetical protein
MVAAGLLKDLERNPHTQDRDRLPTSSINSLDLEILRYRHKILWPFMTCTVKINPTEYILDPAQLYCVMGPVI